MVAVVREQQRALARSRVVREGDHRQVALALDEPLAEAADIFVFAWKSASHQALYCIKKATMKVEPAYPQGKGTASIVRAVLDQVG